MDLEVRTIKTFQEFRLTESLSSARNKFLETGKVDQKTFDQLKAIDPSTTFKYLEAMIKFHLDGASMDDIEATIKTFHKMSEKNQIKQKDINSYKTFDDLTTAVRGSDVQYGLKQASKEKSKDAKTVFEDERYRVIVPRTHEASCKYGAGTKWCITEENPKHWEMYDDMAVSHYFILDKKLIEIISKKEAIERDLQNKKITEAQAEEELQKLERQANSIDRKLDDNLYKIAVSISNDSKIECVDAADEKMEFDDVVKVTGLDEELFRWIKPDRDEIEMLSRKAIRYICENDIDRIIKNEDGSFDVNGKMIINPILAQEVIDYLSSNKDLPVPLMKVRKISKITIIRNEAWRTGMVKDDPDTLMLNRIMEIEEVDHFICNDCNIASLEGLLPKRINKELKCYRNKLTSLQGAPQEVGGDFDCQLNQLTSLEGAPQKIGGNFNCLGNKLASLEGAPKEVGGNFNCSNNVLTSLQGAPQKVVGDFDCSSNKLTTLEGAPQEVGGIFNCAHNRLTSLRGAPQEVGFGYEWPLTLAQEEVGGFNCVNNKLTSLEGAPLKVKGSFNCDNNELTSLEGAPKMILGKFNCRNNQNIPQSEMQWANSYFNSSVYSYSPRPLHISMLKGKL